MNPPPSHSHNSYTSFPILAISILGILTTAILLLSYYIFVIKCCLHWPRRPDLLLLRLTSSPRRRRRFTPSPPSPSPASDPPRGLDISTINSIPTSRFSTKTSTTTIECSVCISDFRDQELLRVLPVCAHAFHIDCIDTWLQFNPNCPLCRADISLVPMHYFGRSPDPRESNPADLASVTIDVRDESSTPRPTAKKEHCKKMKSMGDECIDMRGERDERFVVQPIRRSFSMDSSNDRQLYLSVQEVLRQARSGEGSSGSAGGGGGGGGGGGNGSGRIRRSLFSFGRSSRSTASVLPL